MTKKKPAVVHIESFQQGEDGKMHPVFGTPKPRVPQEAPPTKFSEYAKWHVDRLERDGITPDDTIMDLLDRIARKAIDLGAVKLGEKLRSSPLDINDSDLTELSSDEDRNRLMKALRALFSIREYFKRENYQAALYIAINFSECLILLPPVSGPDGKGRYDFVMENTVQPLAKIGLKAKRASKIRIGIDTEAHAKACLRRAKDELGKRAKWRRVQWKGVIEALCREFDRGPFWVNNAIKSVNPFTRKRRLS